MYCRLVFACVIVAFYIHIPVHTYKARQLECHPSLQPMLLRLHHVGILTVDFHYPGNHHQCKVC